MYKSIFSTFSTRTTKGPRLCWHRSRGLNECHWFIVRRWPNLDCIYGEWEGRMDVFQMTFEPYMCLQALCRDCMGSCWVKRALWRVFRMYWRGDASCSSWLDMCCQNGLIHAASLCMPLYWLRKKMSCQAEPAQLTFIYFSAFSCKAFKVSSYYIICRLVPAKWILSWRLWPSKGLAKVTGR